MFYLLNSLRKRDKMAARLTFYRFSPTRLINSIKHEHSCKILYVLNSHMLEFLNHNAFTRSIGSLRSWIRLVKHTLQIKNKKVDNNTIFFYPR